MNQQLRRDYYCVTEWNATSETMHALSQQWGIDQNRPYLAEGKLILFDNLHKIVFSECHQFHEMYIVSNL